MNDKQDLLVEIGTEELPPKALTDLIDAFAQGIETQLSQLGLQHTKIQSFATPRRLTVLVENLDTAQQDKQVERRGPAVKARRCFLRVLRFRLGLRASL